MYLRLVIPAFEAVGSCVQQTIALPLAVFYRLKAQPLRKSLASRT